MDEKQPLVMTRQMGESLNQESNSLKTQDIQCDTFARLVHVEWDDQAVVLPVKTRKGLTE